MMKGFHLRLAVCFAMGALAVSGQSMPVAARDLIAAAPMQQAYLQNEGNRIIRESRRVASEAVRLRAEAVRLEGEEKRLLLQADSLDAEWLKAKEAAPDTVREFPGRDRSQVIMRADANRIASEITRLKVNAEQLDLEAKRLERLSADVFELMRKLGNSGSGAKEPNLGELQMQIRVMARAHSVSWNPT